MAKRQIVLPDHLSRLIPQDRFNLTIKFVNRSDCKMWVYPLYKGWGYLVRPYGRCQRDQYEQFFQFGWGNAGFRPSRTVWFY